MTNLIARQDHIKKLGDILKNVLRGQFQIVFVTGEAGAGKTVLVRAFIEKARRDNPGLFVAASKCHQIAGGRQDPNLPFEQILESISTEKKGDARWDRLRRGIAELAPDWVQLVPVAGGFVAATWRTAQWGQREFAHQGQGVDTQRRMVQYTNALRLAAETAPLLLWIDDLHWSDNATLDLISFLADHASDAAIMLIAAYRPGEVAFEIEGRPHPLRRLTNKLKRHSQCVELQVPNYSRADLEQFLATTKHRFPGAFVQRLWRQSGGNPLFVGEYVKLLHMRRLLKREGGDFVLAQADAEAEIPDTVQVVIAQRLDAIGRDLRRLLSYASVQGERFAAHVLAQLMESPELDVLEKLNLLDRVHSLIRELEIQHLIVKVGTEYQFIHVLMQQVLYNDLSAGQRRHLHRTVAFMLENLYGEHAAQQAADLAIHFERGAELSRAIHYYLQASLNALNVQAWDDALAQAQAVRWLCKRVSAEKSIQWNVQALVHIAEVHYWKSEFDEALAVCLEGESLCQQSGLDEQRALFLYWRSRIVHGLGRTGELLQVIKQAIEILGDAPENPRLQGRLYASLGSLYFLLPTDEAQQALNTALAIAEEHSFFDVKAIVLRQKAWIAMNRTYEFEKAYQFAMDALTITQNHNLSGLVRCHRLVAYTCRRLGRGEEAFAHNQEAVTIAKQRGMPRELHKALYSLAIFWSGVREDWGESLKVLREAIAVAEQYHFPASRDVLGTWFGVALNMGLWRETEQALDHFHAAIDPSYPRSWGSYYRYQGTFAYAFGSFDEAIKALEHAISIFDERSPSKGSAKAAQIYLGFAFLAAGQLKRGRDELEQSCRYWQDKGKVNHHHLRSLHGLARADLLQGSPVQAIALLRKSLAMAEGLGDSNIIWPIWLCAEVDLGKALLAAGEAEAGLEHALAGYNKLKKLKCFLLGEAAFAVGQILTALGKRDQALAYLQEARREWLRLELMHHLPAWDAFMQEHGYAVNKDASL